MPIGALTMILANVGLQVYNNWCGNRQNSELQQKREEFERAARDRNTEHMWKLLREGQALTMQMEAERHDDRLKGLKDEVDNLLKRLAYEEAIKNWPLKVLPIVMKNQAIGNLLSRQTENEDVAMHVVFTRSNYDKFNHLVYPIVEKQLEQYCDKHWSTLSDHPVLFYSGAWKSQCNPTGVEISSMRTALCNLPTLLITPFFRPGDGKLVFQVNMWGVGAATTDQFNIPEIEPLDFQRQFSNQDDYENEMGLLDEIVEDLVPYIQCLIGYMADTYFWSSSGLAPHLPLLVTNGTINTDGMKYLVSDSGEYYDQLLLSSEENAKKNPFVQENLMNIYEGCAELWDEKTKSVTFEKIMINYFDGRTGTKHSSVSEIDDFDCKLFESHVIDKLIHLCPNNNTRSHLCHIKEIMEHQPLSLKIKQVQRLSIKELIERACENVPTNADDWHLFIDDSNDFKLIVTFFTKDDDVIYNQQSDIQVYITKIFAVPQNLNMGNGIDITIDQLKEISNHLANLSM